MQQVARLLNPARRAGSIPFFFPVYSASVYSASSALRSLVPKSETQSGLCSVSLVFTPGDGRAESHPELCPVHAKALNKASSCGFPAVVTLASSPLSSLLHFIFDAFEPRSSLCFEVCRTDGSLVSHRCGRNSVAKTHKHGRQSIPSLQCVISSA